ncbi:uncharacterized protein [Rutidosis leptorrhynchoides]|uniref:uncharacterized protein n=1 Tax=Rutidosis leptorrhynchoides TaxID=125765 RepID=UPI003A990A55
MAALTFNHLEKKMLVEQIFKKSIETNQLAAIVEEDEHCWMTNIIEFLKTGTLPADDKEAKKIRVKAPMYELRDDVLYEKPYLGPSFCCVGPKQAERIIDEVYSGACALHSVFRTVAEKIKRVGYYWPGMYNDAAERMRVCQQCQLHAPISKSSAPPKDPHNIIMALLQMGYRYSGTISRWIWFGILNEIVSDNAMQFKGEPFRSWCQGLNIKQSLTSVVHPQANGQCEVTNRDIVHAIKARIGKQ